MNPAQSQSEQIKLAQDIHQACIETAEAAYRNASMSGLCADGAWECALGALRAMDLQALLAQTDL